MLEVGRRHLGNLRAVFDYQRGAGAQRRGLGLHACGRGAGQFLRARQIERDHRAATDRTGDGRRAAGLLRETVDLAQTESRAFADLLGREIRLEYVRQNVGSDPAAGIGDADSDELATEPLLRRLALEHHRLDRDAERAAPRHRIAGVHREIEYGEFELARIDLDRAALVRNRDFCGDVVAQRAREHVLEFGEPLAEIDHRGGEHLSARKCEQLPRETFAPASRVHDHVDDPTVLFRGQIAAQALRAAADDHQQIIEVVRDAAGQMSDGFQALGLPQRALRGLAALGFIVKPPRAPQRDRDDE